MHFLTFRCLLGQKILFYVTIIPPPNRGELKIKTGNEELNTGIETRYPRIPGIRNEVAGL